MHCKKSFAKFFFYIMEASRNSDVDNGGANQTTWGSENSYSHVVWFCATVVNIGIFAHSDMAFLQCVPLQPSILNKSTQVRNMLVL
jgi:hypothetical protein